MLLVLLISSLAYHQVSKVEIEATAFENMFPEQLEVIRGSKIAEDQFFGSKNMFVVVFLESSERASIKDIRDPDVASYIARLQGKLTGVEGITDTRSYVDFLQERNSLDNIKLQLRHNPVARGMVSRDYAMTIIRVQVSDISGREEEFIKSVESAISSVPPPPGVRVVLCGDPVNAKIFKELTGKDMQSTTKFSFLGILFFTALVLYSLRYSFIPIVSVGLGTLWTFGIMGTLGIKISSTMAGVVSMIMGIGIDFAIQIIGRYLQETQGYFGRALRPEEAMEVTLKNVIKPMTITTLAALIGFRALTLAQLKFMHDLANVMSLGVLTCMLSALTFVPSIVLIMNKIKEVKN